MILHSWFELWTKKYNKKKNWELNFSNCLLPWGEKDYVAPWSKFQMFDKKAQGINIVQIKPYIYHWKVLKKFIFKIIFHFRFEVMNGILWEKIFRGQIFQCSFVPSEESLVPQEYSIAHGRKGVGKNDPNFSFFDNFMFITSKIKHHFRYLRWKSFPMIYKMFDLNNVRHLSFLVKHFL